MNETMSAEFLTPTLSDLLQVVVWGGLAAGVLLVWRPRLARGLVRVQSGLAAAIGAGLAAMFLTGGAPVVIDYGSWLAVPSNASAGIQIAHRLDSTAAMLLFAVATAFLLRESREARGERREPAPAAPFFGLLQFFFLQAALQFVLIDDAVLRVAFLPLMSLCWLFQRVGAAAATTGDIVAARRGFLFRTAGDALLLLGTALLISSGSAGGAAELLLWVGVLVRAAGYPFFSDDGSPDDDPLALVLLLPAGIVVLLRTSPAETLANSSGHGLLYGGVALALLAAGVAAARPRNNLAAIAVALTGLMLAGLGSGSAVGRQGAVLLFVSTVVILPLTGSSGKGSFFSALLLGLGIGGQGIIFAMLFSQPSTLFAGGLFLASHLLTALSLIRAPSRETRRPSFPIDLLAVLAVVAMVVAVQAIGPGSAVWQKHAFEYVLLGIAGAIGLTAGWMTRQRDVVSARPPGTFRRWLRAGFYLEEFFLLAVVLPVRAAAQLCRFCEWFIIERLWNLPRRTTAWAGRLGEPLQGESVRLSMAAILLATAALLTVIVAW